jgi:uncharacterized protein (DUF1015 family)
MKNEVRAFRGLCYNPEKVERIGDCLSQPYDVISQEQLNTYYRKHEYNVVRLILNREEPGDGDSYNRYTRARDTFTEWKRKGIIRRSDRSCLWIYEQRYRFPDGEEKRQRGFIGAVRLQDYDRGSIMPHEKLMKNPLEDRIRLTRATRTQFEAVWGFYLDRGSTVDGILGDVSRKKPFLDYEEHLDEGKAVRHLSWRLEDKAAAEEICRAVARRRIYIADGHHRYQTMLSLREELRSSAESGDSDTPWEFIMMFLVNAEREGLTILPYHRTLHGLPAFDGPALKKKLAEYFTIEQYEMESVDDPAAMQRWLSELRARGERRTSFGLFMAGAAYYMILRLKEAKRYLALSAKEGSRRWRLLDVNVLDHLIFGHILGITETQLIDQSAIEYHSDALDAIEAVRNNSAQAAFLVNPTELTEVTAISGRGEVLPRKSTYFYPKPVSGILFYPLEPRPI